MSFAQRTLEGLVQLRRADGLALLLAQFHQGGLPQPHFHCG
ncbi:hypothetical protein [Paraburkholderia panacisoli]|nr:hypothetical protein [Paraburkholderia panacisoli]